MSQKSEKYNRALGRNVELLWCGLVFQALRLKDMEDSIFHLQAALEKQNQKELPNTALCKAVSLLIHEQRRRKISQQRILFLIKMAAICALLIWLSFQILIS